MISWATKTEKIYYVCLAGLCPAAGCAYSLVQDIYIIQSNGFSALMDDSHKMIAGRELRGTPHKVEGLLVEAIWLTVNAVNDNRHRPETLPALLKTAFQIE